MSREGWATARVSEICELLNGRAYKQSELLERGKYRVLRVGNFFSNPNWYYSNLELDQDKYCYNGDLLYAWSASFGPRIWEGEKAIFHYHIWRVMTDEAVVNRSFLYRWFEWDKENIKAEHGTGSTMIHVTKGNMEQRPIFLPPLAEQKRIVTKLDALTARTSRASADLDRVPAMAAQYKRAILAAAFRGDLTAEWRGTNEDQCEGVEVLEEARRDAWARLPRRRGKYDPGINADWRPEIALPATWRWASIDQLVHVIQYGTSAKTSDQIGVPVLRMGNIRDGVLDLSRLKYLPADHEEFPELLLDNGDLLFNRTNSAELVGKTAVYSGKGGSTSFASYLIRLKTFGSYLPELLAAYVNSPFGREWIAGSTSQQVGQANVNGTKLRGLGVPVMPMSEQRRIWALIKAAFAKVDRLTADSAAARRLLDRLDQAILTKAFQGELVSQDPADEPASALLDRIRTERAAAPAMAKRGRKLRAA